MPSKRPDDIKPSEITERKHFLSRRRIIQAAGGIAAGGILAATLPLLLPGKAGAVNRGGPGVRPLEGVVPGPFAGDEDVTSYRDATSYNNFYEFGTGKEDPARNAGELRTRPWSVTVDGHCERPGTYDLEDIMRPHALEERIYRLRCVEAWSMVIPWVGFPLGDVLRRFAPDSRAKYVAFTTLLDPEQMPGQKRKVLDWPYREGLRMDEAMHPLTILAVGMYGEVLPNQNGAPLRLVVPWKYGFKSIKSIVRIRFTERMPVTSWNLSAPHEYGFYANVNPAVSHPRWSQAKERRIGAGIFTPKRDTQPFNGYGKQVASLYTGMDLKKAF